MFVAIGGVRRYLGRAVDQYGNALDILIQSKRDGKAATSFFRILLKKQGRTAYVNVTNPMTTRSRLAVSGGPTHSPSPVGVPIRSPTDYQHRTGV